MKHFKLIPIIVAVIFALSSCTFVERILSNPEGKSGQTINNVVEAIKTKDSEKIISLFSKAVQERVDLSDQTEDFFDFIEGEIVSIEKGGYSQFDSTSGGVLVTKTVGSVFLNTSEGKYEIDIFRCTNNEGDNDEIGATSIVAVNFEDIDSYCEVPNSEIPEGLSVYVKTE